MDAPVQIQEAIACSKFKVEWAKNHIKAVESLVDQIKAQDADTIRFEDDPQTGMTRVLIGPKQFMPIQLLLHLGDAVHNLNGVMDYLWSGLVRSVSPNAVFKPTFPRHEARQNLEAEIANPKGASAAVHQAFPQAKTFLLDRVKPYKADDGASLIWRLNKLDNVNKHRLLIASSHVVKFEGDIKLTGADNGSFTLPSSAAIETQGHPLAIGLTSPVKLDNQPKAIVDVIFVENDLFPRQPVLETLVDLTEATSEVIKAFEETFL